MDKGFLFYFNKNQFAMILEQARLGSMHLPFTPRSVSVLYGIQNNVLEINLSSVSGLTQPLSSPYTAVVLLSPRLAFPTANWQRRAVKRPEGELPGYRKPPNLRKPRFPCATAFPFCFIR
jgi:hypothetical protein